MIHRSFIFLLSIITALAQDAPRAIVVETAAPQYHSVTLQGIHMQCVSFDIRTHALQVLDQPNGPGSQWPTCQDAAKSVNGLAAINAGFFTPAGKPLGVVIANNVRAGSNNASSLGSGVWYEANGRSAIIRREKTNFRAPHLIQAGPMLAEKSQSIKGLDATRTSARCFLAWDGGSRWLIARTAPCSLHALSTALAGASPAAFPISTALNLDGGRSAELHVSSSINGGPLTTRPFWNNPVRNFLVLTKR